MQKSLSSIAAIAIALACGVAVAAEPTIDTIAGGGAYNGSIGDGGPAKQAVLGEISDIAVDASGNLYIAESCRIRKVALNGVITTFGGNGTSGTPVANGAKAWSGALCTPSVAVDASGQVWYFSAGRLGKISPAGTVTFIAGSGKSGYSGDGGPASQASFGLVADIAIDGGGNVFIADANRVRRIDAKGIVTTVAGNGEGSGFGSRDGGQATTVTVTPTDLAFDAAGNLIFVDRSDYSLRRVNANGVISRVLGAFPRFRSDPMAFPTDPYYPSGLAVDAAGNIFVGNTQNFVSLISPDNAIKHVVGIFGDTTFDEDGYGALPGFGGDGGPAQLAMLREPTAIALDAKGNLYIADSRNYRVRKVTGTFTRASKPAGAFAFKPAKTFDSVSGNQNTVGIVKGDANWDDRDDIFLLSGNWDPTTPQVGDYTLWTYRQKADGTLDAPVATPLPKIIWNDVMAIELNNDGYTDIVASGYSYSGSADGIYVMLGGPNGMSAPKRYIGIDGLNHSGDLMQADMNRDGRMDVLVFLATSGSSGSGGTPAWAIFYSNGAGGFSGKKFTPIKRSSGSVIQDFNGDGQPDMLMGWSSGSSAGISIAYHDGINNFLPPTDYPGITGPDRMTSNWVAAGDFDSDGRKDVIFAIDYNAPYAKLVQWTQRPAGDFEYVRAWDTYDTPEALIAADMNGDDLDDLLVKHTGWSSVGFLQQARRVGGTYGLDRETKAYAAVGNTSQRHSMAIGDFNNDQCLDIAVSGSNNPLQIQYNKVCRKEKQGPDSPAWSKVTITTGTTSSPSPPVAATQATSQHASTTSADKVYVAVNAFIRKTRLVIPSREVILLGFGALALLFAAAWLFAPGNGWLGRAKNR